MSDFVVGLRGGIGTGKTSVSNLFAARGITVADADVSARSVVEPGRPAYNAIIDHFGSAIIQEDKSLDRAKLREIVFADDKSRKFLEQQTQGPIVEDLVATISKAASAYAVLVLSTGLGKWPLMQRLLVVDAPIEVQVERVMTRDNNSREQVEAILRAQPSRERRVQDADDIILNDGDFSRLELEVDKLDSLYMQLSKEQPNNG